MTEERKCSLCGAVVRGRRTCCGQRTVGESQSHAETPLEKWVCPSCGKQSDTSRTCCGKKAVRNADFPD